MSVLPLTSSGLAGPNDAPSALAVANAKAMAAAAGNATVAAANPGAAAAAMAALYGTSNPSANVGAPAVWNPPNATRGSNSTRAVRPPPPTILTVPGTNVSAGGKPPLFALRE